MRYRGERVKRPKILGYFGNVLAFLLRIILTLASHSQSRGFAAYMLSICCSDIHVRGRNNNNIWVLSKEGLAEDLNEVFRYFDNISVKSLSRGIPKSFAKRFLNNKINDNNYDLLCKEDNEGNLKYRQFWNELFCSMSVSRRPRIVLTGNFGYYAEREISSACTERSISFIALHKECLKSQGRIDFFKSVYSRRGRFGGKLIIVYNNVERKLQIESGVASEGQIITCGMPRLDRLHKLRMDGGFKRGARPTLLAFGFTPETGLPRIPNKGLNGGPTSYEYLSADHVTLTWKLYFLAYHEVIVRLAKDHPTFDIIFKLKGRFRDAQPSAQLLGELGTPPNLYIRAGGDPFEYFKCCDAVCAFNSTVVLEGLACGLPVVTPEFFEVINPDHSIYAARFGEATISPPDPQSMYEVLRDLLCARVMPVTNLGDNSMYQLDYWAGNADGLASRRVANVLRDQLVAAN